MWVLLSETWYLPGLPAGRPAAHPPVICPFFLGTPVPELLPAPAPERARHQLVGHLRSSGGTVVDYVFGGRFFLFFYLRSSEEATGLTGVFLFRCICLVGVLFFPKTVSNLSGNLLLQIIYPIPLILVWRLLFPALSARGLSGPQQPVFLPPCRFLLLQVAFLPGAGFSSTLSAGRFRCREFSFSVASGFPFSGALSCFFFCLGFFLLSALLSGSRIFLFPGFSSFRLLRVLGCSALFSPPQLVLGFVTLQINFLPTQPFIPCSLGCFGRHFIQVTSSLSYSVLFFLASQLPEPLFFSRFQAF